MRQQHTGYLFSTNMVTFTIWYKCNVFDDGAIQKLGPKHNTLLCHIIL